MVYLWHLPREVIWHILTYLEPEPSDLYNLSDAFKRVHYILINESTWYRFIRRRFNVIPDWDALHSHVHRLDSLSHVYHRLREVNSVLNEIHDNIGFRLYRKFGSVLSQKVCHAKCGYLLDILKSFTNTYIVYNVYAVKRDFYYLMQSQKRVPNGSGLAVQKLVISPEAELFTIHLDFSGNTLHFEKVVIPVLFDTCSVCRDVDILFKEDFFTIVTTEVRNRVGYCLKRNTHYSADPHCLRQDYTALAAFCFSMVDVYSGDTRLSVIKRQHTAEGGLVGGVTKGCTGATISDLIPVPYAGRIDFLRELLD